jgi:hypothetical protein
LYRYGSNLTKEAMLARVRRNRWMIALLLVLFGHPAEVRASTVPPCPNADGTSDVVAVDAQEASATAATFRSGGPRISEPGAHVPSDPAGQPAPAPACGATALPSPVDVRALDPGGWKPLAVAREPGFDRLLAHPPFRPPIPS